MVYMGECKHPGASIVEKIIKRRDGKEVLVRVCAECESILEVICLKCKTKKWKNDHYTRKDGTIVLRFTCPECGKSISLVAAEIIADKKCIGTHEDLRETAEIRKDNTRIEVFKCGKCGEVEAYCKRCKRWMWHHKTYTRKSDGKKMIILRCPNCGVLIYVDSNGLPPRRKHRSHRAEPVDIEEIIGLKLTRCIYCGKKLRNFEAYLVNSGKIKILRKRCTVCGRTQSIVTLLRQVYAIFASCPTCGGEEIIVANSYGKPRLKCRKCGTVFDFRSIFKTHKSVIPRRASEEASRWLFPLLDTLLAIFSLKYDVPPRTMTSISMVSRAFRNTTSYRFLESLMLSPRPFTLCRNAPDQATIQRYAYRIDIFILQQIVEFLAGIVLNGKIAEDVMLLAIDSTVATSKSSFYPDNRASIKFHGRVDINTRMILDIDFRWSVEDIEMELDYDFFIAFILGDKEYWATSFSRRLLKRHIVPVASPRGCASDDETLMVLRWLQKRHLKELRRVRGIVEEIFSYLVPHSNVLSSHLSHTMMVEILVRAIIWNVIIIGSILDSYVREQHGVSLTQFLGGKGLDHEAKLETLNIGMIASLINEAFGEHIAPSSLSKQLNSTWFLLEFCGGTPTARISKQKP